MDTVRGLWQKKGMEHYGSAGRMDARTGATVWGVSVVWNTQRLRMVSQREIEAARIVRVEFEIVGDVQKQRMVVLGCTCRCAPRTLTLKR